MTDVKIAVEAAIRADRLPALRTRQRPPSGLRIACPARQVAQMRPRSGLAISRGITVLKSATRRSDGGFGSAGPTTAGDGC